jgi:hypothetical protein
LSNVELVWLLIHFRAPLSDGRKKLSGVPQRSSRSARANLLSRIVSSLTQAVCLLKATAQLPWVKLSPVDQHAYKLAGHKFMAPLRATWPNSSLEQSGDGCLKASVICSIGTTVIRSVYKLCLCCQQALFSFLQKYRGVVIH